MSLPATRRATMTVISAHRRGAAPTHKHFQHLTADVPTYAPVIEDYITPLGPWPAQSLITTLNPRRGIGQIAIVKGSLVFETAVHHRVYVELRGHFETADPAHRPPYGDLVKIAQVLSEQHMSLGDLTDAELTNFTRWAAQQ